MDPPTILLFCNREKDIPTHYKRYLSSGIREHFKLRNTPVHLLFRTEESASRQKNKSSESAPAQSNKRQASHRQPTKKKTSQRSPQRHRK
jgi:hypothetical protein